MPKKILLIGGDEIIGESLMKYIEYNTEHELLVVTPDISLESTTSMQFADIFDKDKLKNICYELSPDLIINTAEYSGIKECEMDKKKASDYNLILSNNLVRIANIIDARYIGFSSDLIFDGTDGTYGERAKPTPINYYGRTKHGAENTIRTESIPWVLIRTSCPFGLSRYGKKDLVYEVVENLHLGNEVTLSDKLIRTPIYTEDLACVVGEIIDNNEIKGLFNISGHEKINMYDFACQVAESFGYDKNLVINSANPNELYPKYCGLNNFKASKNFDMENISSAGSALDALAFLYEQYGILKKIDEQAALDAKELKKPKEKSQKDKSEEKLEEILNSKPKKRAKKVKKEEE